MLLFSEVADSSGSKPIYFMIIRHLRTINHCERMLFSLLDEAVIW